MIHGDQNFTVMVQILQIRLEGSKPCMCQRETLSNEDAQVLRLFDLSQREGSLLASLSYQWPSGYSNTGDMVPFVLKMLYS